MWSHPAGRDRTSCTPAQSPLTVGRGQLPAHGGVGMAGRRSLVTDVREILRRLQLGEPDRRIARDLAVGRNTVARYRQWAQDQGLLHAALPEPPTLAALLRPAP